MSATYVPVQWNRQKRRHDVMLAIIILAYFVSFVMITLVTNSEVTIETLINRSTGSLAIVMLHVILLIGPLNRLWPKLRPLLYNRRHLGVTMLMIALIHGVFVTMQFHVLGDTQPVVSILTANQHFDALSRFPFQTLGLLALVILLVMAATSHDFWLKNLSPSVWKSMHMMVYVAYAALIGHVSLGILQYEATPSRYVLISLGVLAVSVAHISAAFKERRSRHRVSVRDDALVKVCALSEIPDNRAIIVLVEDQEIAIFKYEGKISAIHNLCKHQNGPLGEGKIVDGCITCPWHGYQYAPGNGCSPPPFTEKVHTYRLEIRLGDIFVNPDPLPEGTAVPPVEI